jgi:hypothetical protein
MNSVTTPRRVTVRAAWAQEDGCGILGLIFLPFALSV